MMIVHTTLKTNWEKAQESGKFGFDAIKENGFIPCLKIEDVNAENFTSPSIRDNVILCIDTDKVDTEIKEDGSHVNIYGMIDKSAIISTITYTSDTNDKFVMNDELKDMMLLNDVLTKMNMKYESHQYFKDGSFSRTIFLNGKYVLKQNQPALLKSEVLFAEKNTNPKLQRIAYYDSEFRYILYHYVPGEVMHTVEDFDDLLSNVKEIIDSYAPYSGPEFGKLCEPVTSWTDFLKEEVHEASLTLKESFDFLPQVYNAIEVLEQYPFEKKLLHGDFGTHNFIKYQGKFNGAIDPIPTAGDPLYDLLFVLVSNIDILPHIPLDYLYEMIDEPNEKIKAMFTIVLFSRLARCLTHHKADFDTYIDYWYANLGDN